MNRNEYQCSAASGCFIRIGGVLAFFALAIAGFARLTAICPPRGPASIACHAEANREAMEILGYLLIPSGVLLAIALLLFGIGRH